MRGLREFRQMKVLYGLMIIPLIAIGFGVHYWMKKRGRGPTHYDSAMTNKPSQHKKGAHDREDGPSAQAKAADPLARGDHDGICGRGEFPGRGMAHTKATDKDWEKVMVEFHRSKDQLIAWAQKHHKSLPPKQLAKMTEMVRELRIQRPSRLDEPDLAWRGIAAWTEDLGSDPLIRVGSGFVELAMKNPERARFEMTRLVAQAWSPCELAKNKVEPIWNPLLSCMGVKDANSCGERSYSEAGWAVSTAVAAAIAPPGCKVPAFEDEKLEECVEDLS